MLMNYSVQKTRRRVMLKKSAMKREKWNKGRTAQGQNDDKYDDMEEEANGTEEDSTDDIYYVRENRKEFDDDNSDENERARQ